MTEPEQKAGRGDAVPRPMTKAQGDVLLTLNLLQMRSADCPEEGGITAAEIARATAFPRSARSAAVVLSQMREFGWVRSIHLSGLIGWVLVDGGVTVLERDRRRSLR